MQLAFLAESGPHSAEFIMLASLIYSEQCYHGGNLIFQVPFSLHLPGQ